MKILYTFRAIGKCILLIREIPVNDLMSNVMKGGILLEDMERECRSNGLLGYDFYHYFRAVSGWEQIIIQMLMIASAKGHGSFSFQVS